MNFSRLYERQVRLLLEVLPFVRSMPHFALKGGTAINLFVRDLPRLSIDIDLVYLPITNREEALQQIEDSLLTIKSLVEKSLNHATVQLHRLKDTGSVDKLYVRRRGIQITIEVSTVIRGTVEPSSIKRVSPIVEAEFGFGEALVTSNSDLFGGKIVAALDRQHPRDLFDVRVLLSSEGLTARIIEAVIVYLVSHSRPICELLDPNLKDLSQEFENHFEGMTTIDISLEDLYEARHELLISMNKKISEAQKEFLISFESGAPNWSLLSIPDADKLPAVRWRLANQSQMTHKTRQDVVNRLEEVFNNW